MDVTYNDKAMSQGKVIDFCDRCEELSEETYLFHHKNKTQF